MARIELASGVLDDFERFLDHLAKFEVADASARIGKIIRAIQILTHSPLIGRPVKGGNRELVIGQDARGYRVPYRFIPRIDTVFVLAVCSQTEATYKRGRPAAGFAPALPGR